MTTITVRENAVESIQAWELGRLRPHPENSAIFGDPSESKQYGAILRSIRENGIWEPLVIKVDGTILSGHLRYACALQLKLKAVPVRVRQAFEHYRDEVSFVIRSNTDRRQLSLQEVAFAFKRLKELPKAEGGAKRKQGRPENSVGGKNKSGESPGLIGDTRDDAATAVGVSTDIARAAEMVFTSEDVPSELKAAVNSGKVAPTTAAKQVREERKRQGGTITDPTRLVAVAERQPEPSKYDSQNDHERRLEEQANKFKHDFAKLLDAYRAVDAVLTRMPLKSVIGPGDHHAYRDLIRDVALRAWREIEATEGASDTGRQIALSVVRGGKQ